MSSLPGETLEDFLMWNYDLIVDDNTSSNKSLEIAELIGIETKRKKISKEQFKPLVDIFEKYRIAIEYFLIDFDENTQSWRDYSQVIYDYVPEKIFNKGFHYIKFIGGVTNDDKS